MKYNYENQKNQLIDRIENNFYAFKCSLDGVSRETLIKMARRIAAVTEAYEMLTQEYVWDEEGEIEFYLLFRDPLTIIADAWESRLSEMAVDFDEAMFDVGYSDKTISEYPLIDGADIKLYENIMPFAD